jgi:hypothetical protein
MFVGKPSMGRLIDEKHARIQQRPDSGHQHSTFVRQ